MSVFESSPQPWPDRVLAVIRIITALIFITSGTTKMFGVPPMPQAVEIPPFSQVWIGSWLEIIGGFLILIGLFTRPVAFILSGMMAVAYFQYHAPMSFWPTVNQGISAILYCFFFLYLVFAGAGAWSLDRLLARRRRLGAAVLAALVLASCTTATAPRAFVSDRISVETRGTGPDLILIPGLTGHREIWAGVAETLDDRYRLHLVQVNGFAGFEAGPNAEGVVAAPVAEEVARYIREAGLARPAVIGHSMGGTIGMMVAARHPDAVGRLMLVDIAPSMVELFPAGTTPETLRTTADQVRSQILTSPPGEGFIGQMFRTMTLKPEMEPMLLRHLHASDRRTVGNAFHELLVTDLRPELSRITAPVTVLYVIPSNAQMPPDQYDATMKRLYANIPGVRLARIDDSRHFIHWDQPARFIAEVDTFMRP